MDYKQLFIKSKEVFLNDPKLCKENKSLFKKFFDYEEYKLKRSNDLGYLDDGNYKTLYDYIKRFKNVNKWFKHKAWKKLTKKDIKEVYDDLEEGKITNSLGERFGDRKAYYSKIFKSKPFELAGKKEMCKEVMEFYAPNNDQEVRFVEQEDIDKLVSVVTNPTHKLLILLAWDIGENINSLLRLQKKEFIREMNDRNEAEYRIILQKSKLKRSRKARSEITNFKETATFIDTRLSNLEDEDLLFPFEYRQALKFLHRAIKLSGVRVKPTGDAPSWKDLRSGMACNLLREGWSSDEVNARLGHKPSSRELDKYINFLALDRHKPKRKIYENNLQKLQDEIETFKEKERLQTNRFKRQEEQIKEILISQENLRESHMDEVYERLEKQHNSKKTTEKVIAKTRKAMEQYVTKKYG